MLTIGIAIAGINSMRDYDGGAGIDRVFGGGSTHVGGGTAGASRRFAEYAPNGTSSTGADAIGIRRYRQVLQHSDGGGGSQLGGQVGTSVCAN